MEQAGELPGAKPLPVAGAIAGPTPSTYAYVKAGTQRPFIE
jgi:hypothetical protein